MFLLSSYFFCSVISLLLIQFFHQENIFPSEKIQKKVLDYWDKAHYYQAAKKSRKPLTALARFRIRER